LEPGLARRIYTSMSHARTRSIGWSGAALLLFQVATFATWQALEAWQLDLTPSPHVEPAGESGCPAPHDEALCRICQVTSLGLTAPTVRLPLIHAETPDAVHHQVADVTGKAVLRVGAPRAPPLSFHRDHRPA
jgi:hypothetical protein